VDLDAAVIIWNAAPGKNVDHVADNGLTPAEVDAVIRDPGVPVEFSRTTGRPCKTGTLPDGRRVFVVWVVRSDRPPAIYPVTAYEVP
jgi:hypothetical protein